MGATFFRPLFHINFYFLHQKIEKRRKATEKRLKKNILMREQVAPHLFAGQNIQHDCAH